MTLREYLRRWLTGRRRATVEPPTRQHRRSTYMEDGCPCCPAPPRPLDVVAEMERAAEAEWGRVIDQAYTEAWLVEWYPDAWYRESPQPDDAEKFAAFANGILKIRLLVAAGMVSR